MVSNLNGIKAGGEGRRHTERYTARRCRATRALPARAYLPATTLRHSYAPAAYTARSLYRSYPPSTRLLAIASLPPPSFDGLHSLCLSARGDVLLAFNVNLMPPLIAIARADGRTTRRSADVCQTTFSIAISTALPLRSPPQPQTSALKH